MKTGKPTRLSEKLNAEIVAIRQEQVASMVSEMANFRDGLSEIAESALDTIGNDTDHFLEYNRTWLKTRISDIRMWLTISPWLITGLIASGIALMMAMSWLWLGIMTRSEMKDLGLTRIEQDGQIWLIADPRRTAVKTCTLAETPVLCIEIKEN